jgi:hypothetical protein
LPEQQQHNNAVHDTARSRGPWSLHHLPLCIPLASPCHGRDRTATYTIDGQSVSGVFAADLTLAEVRQLKARQPWAFRDHGYDGIFSLVTLEEFIDIAQAAGRPVGIYPGVCVCVLGGGTQWGWARRRQVSVPATASPTCCNNSLAQITQCCASR